MLAHSPRIVTDGLVLCLDAGNTKSYPGSGTTWSDLSGNGNNGTLVNGVGYNSANGSSLVFDGSDDYASTGKVLIPRTGEYHIEGWVYPNDTSTNKMFVTQYNNTSDSGRFLCFFGSGWKYKDARRGREYDWKFTTIFC